MQTVSEEICGEYLKLYLKCEFIQYNVNNPDIQGEIDVVGINLSDKKVYVCEVAAHLQGLQYVKDKRPDDYNRFYAKFKKDINYVRKYFSEYESITPMIWSPVVKISGPDAKYNTNSELLRLKDRIDKEFNVSLELIINEKFESAVNELRSIALKQTAHFSTPIMRLFQIEEHLNKHLNNYRKKGILST